jgi:hypothetical protein
MAGTPLTNPIAWTTPKVYNSSGATLAAADWNTLANDVALVYAKPYGILTCSGNVNYANGNVLFSGAHNPVLKTNAPASGVGAVTFSASALTAPVAGLYRISMSLMVISGSGDFGFAIHTQGGSTINNAQWISGGSQNASAQNSVFLSVIAPMAATGTTGGYPTSAYASFVSNATHTVVGGVVPTSSAVGQFNTWMSLEYLGSYGNY